MSSMFLGPIFPQELLDAIVGHMNPEEHLETLKSCSLVASTLRHSSQRILLSRLKLDWHDYSLVAEHFADLPHYAGYVTTLVMGKETLRRAGWVGVQADTLAEVLSHLHQVQKCQLGGGAITGPDIPPLVQDFLSRQPLRELDLRSVKIPASLLLNFMKSVPTISLDSAVVANDEPRSPASPVVGVPITALTTLTVYSPQVGEFLVQPQSIPFLAKLQHLAIEHSGRWPAVLITAAASTLQHIEFMCQYNPIVQSEFPRLIALRVLEFFLRDLKSVSQTSVTILGATRTLATLVLPQMCPALEEVVIKRKFQSDREGGNRTSGYVSLMALLDALLTTYPIPPRVTWFLVMAKGSPGVFDAFANAVRVGMPRAEESGRLALRGQVFSGPHATKRPFPL